MYFILTKSFTVSAESNKTETGLVNISEDKWARYRYQLPLVNCNGRQYSKSKFRLNAQLNSIVADNIILNTRIKVRVQKLWIKSMQAVSNRSNTPWTLARKPKEGGRLQFIAKLSSICATTYSWKQFFEEYQRFFNICSSCREQKARYFWQFYGVKNLKRFCLGSKTLLTGLLLGKASSAQSDQKSLYQQSTPSPSYPP